MKTRLLMKEREAKGEVIGGGFLVVGREPETGAFRFSRIPFEHASADSAKLEAKRLAEATPGRAYFVLSVIDGCVVSPDEVGVARSA